jgi:hypothetical protein
MEHPMPGPISQSIELPEHRLPWEALRDFGRQHGLTQVILMAWDGECTHVVTWGEGNSESLRAAAGGNLMKQTLGFPEEDCHEEPRWLKDLREENVVLKSELAAMRARIVILTGPGPGRSG